MKILYFSDDYLPSSTLVHAKMMHELALQLNEMGYKSIVLTPSHGTQTERLVVDNIDGVEIWRFKSPKMRGNGRVQRFIVETMLSLNALIALKKMQLAEIKACVSYSPTIFFSPLLMWFKQKHKTFNYLILRDLFPQWVIDEGIILKYSPLAFYFRFFEKLNYRASDCIGLMSKKNIEFFSEVNPTYTNIEVLRNWSKTTPAIIETLSIDVRSKLNISQDSIVLFYGGNIGPAQDIPNLLRLAEACKELTSACFLFVGQGEHFDLVGEIIKEKSLENVKLLPSVDQQTYKEILTQVDIGLFSLAQSHKAHNFPGKLLGYMVQSLPILGSLNKGNDLVEFINGESAGYAVENGNDMELYLAAKELITRKNLRKEMGNNGYEVLKKYFSVESIATQITSKIV